MTNLNIVVATFTDHQGADTAVKKLADDGIEVKHLSVVDKDYHTDEKVVGFYNSGDRAKFWGTCGAYWGALWGWLSGGVCMFIPVVGNVIVLGYSANMIIAAIEGAIVVGGLGALGGALYSIGGSKDSVFADETALKDDRFLVKVHGPADEAAHAMAILAPANPSCLDIHSGVKAVPPTDKPAQEVA